MAEFRIRALVRRIERAELELREISVRDAMLDEDVRCARRSRRRVLRRWIRDDSVALRALLGAPHDDEGRARHTHSRAIARRDVNTANAEEPR